MTNQGISEFWVIKRSLLAGFSNGNFVLGDMSSKSKTHAKAPAKSLKRKRDVEEEPEVEFFESEDDDADVLNPYVEKSFQDSNKI